MNGPIKGSLLDWLTCYGLGSPAMARNSIVTQFMRLAVSAVQSGAEGLEDSWRAAGFPSM